jgi:hypothetical protein
VDARLVVELAEKPEVVQRGLTAVSLVPDVVDIGGGGGAVAAARPGAVLVAEDDRAPNVAGYRVGVALVSVLHL